MIYRLMIENEFKITFVLDKTYISIYVETRYLYVYCIDVTNTHDTICLRNGTYSMIIRWTDRDYKYCQQNLMKRLLILVLVWIFVFCRLLYHIKYCLLEQVMSELKTCIQIFCVILIMLMLPHSRDGTNIAFILKCFVTYVLLWFRQKLLYWVYFLAVCFYMIYHIVLPILFTLYCIVDKKGIYRPPSDPWFCNGKYPNCINN